MSKYHELDDIECPKTRLYELWCSKCRHEEKEYVETPCDECFRYFVQVLNYEPIQE